MVDKSQGIKELEILHRAGKLNVRTDSLLRNPLPSVTSPEEIELQMSSVDTTDVTTLLQVRAPDPITMYLPLGREQRKDPQLSEIISFGENGELPEDNSRARKLSLLESMFVMVDGVFYKVDRRNEASKW